MLPPRVKDQYVDDDSDMMMIVAISTVYMLLVDLKQAFDSGDCMERKVHVALAKLINRNQSTTFLKECEIPL